MDTDPLRYWPMSDAVGIVHQVYGTTEAGCLACDFDGTLYQVVERSFITCLFCIAWCSEWDIFGRATWDD